jgi:hypothetical protein
LRGGIWVLADDVHVVEYDLDTTHDGFLLVSEPRAVFTVVYDLFREIDTTQH